ncbi:MAG: hypothetical protein AAGA30_07065, partial [Planctomycetota bacterium]
MNLHKHSLLNLLSSSRKNRARKYISEHFNQGFRKLRGERSQTENAVLILAYSALVILSLVCCEK